MLPIHIFIIGKTHTFHITKIIIITKYININGLYFSFVWKLWSCILVCAYFYMSTHLNTYWIPRSNMSCCLVIYTMSGAFFVIFGFLRQKKCWTRFGKQNIYHKLCNVTDIFREFRKVQMHEYAIFKPHFENSRW